MLFTCIRLIMTTRRRNQLTMRQCLTETEAAMYIGMSRSFLAQDRCNGKRKNRTLGPRFIKMGRAVRYLLNDLDEWLEKNKIEHSYPF